ncbi:MAG: hypothetical protein F7C38_04380 [Desulfurococcales archaeon]|nr:hypothetical protein [Desulfurococcales archaeon]
MGDDQGPTPGAGLCLEDLPFVNPESAYEVWSILQYREYLRVDILLYDSPGLEVYARGTLGADCVYVEELHIRSCGEGAERLIPFADEAEVVRISLERIGGSNCVVLVASFNPVARAARLLEKIGITGKLGVLGYRPVVEVA